jgi:hypothetical protein
MGLTVAAVVLASGEAAAEQAATPGWVFGLFAFGSLVALLVLTMMVKVGK